MNTIKRGFIAPIITEDNHVLGASGIPLPVIKTDGDWTRYVPIFESQLEITFDSDGCTVYGTLNAIETLEKYLYDVEYNHSDRFTYNTVGISPPGSDPHVVATTIRGTGLVLESDLLSVTNSLAEFMTPRPLPVDLRVKGQQWLNRQMLGHKWLWTSQPDVVTRLALLKEALTKGTVAVSVDAWWKNDQGLFYSPQGVQNAHWVHVYKVDDTGIYVFDSYNDVVTNNNVKKLTLDHNIQFAKVYFFTKPTQEQNWLIALIQSMLALVGLYKKQKEAVGGPMVLVSVPIPSPEPVKSLLNTFCLAIKDYEGKPGDRNYINNNPGNCRYSPIGYDPKYGVVTKDSKGFAVFSTWDLGFLYLENLVKSKIVSNPTWTILDYFAKFHAPESDGNNPKLYASFVASHCKVGIDFKIADLLL